MNALRFLSPLAVGGAVIASVLAGCPPARATELLLRDTDVPYVASPAGLLEIPGGNQGTSYKGTHLVWTPIGKRRRALSQFDAALRPPPPPPSLKECAPEVDAGLDASRSWIALDTQLTRTCSEGAAELDDFRGGAHLVVGRFGGSPRVVQRCPSGSFSPFNQDQDPTRIGLDGSTLAFLSCNTRTAYVERLDRPTDTRKAFSLPHGVRQIYLAGPFLAVWAPSHPNDDFSAATVTVYRWKTGAVVQRFEGVIDQRIGLASDGTLALQRFAYRSYNSCTASWVVLPLAEELPLPTCFFPARAVDRGQFLWPRSAPTRGDRYSAALVLSDVRTGSTREIVRPTSGLGASFIEGGLIEVIHAGCGATELIQVIRPDAAPATLALPRCPTSLSRVKTVQRSPYGELHLKLRCPRGCVGYVLARVPATREKVSFFQDQGGEGPHAGFLGSPGPVDVTASPGYSWQRRLRRLTTLEISILSTDGPRDRLVARFRIRLAKSIR